MAISLNVQIIGETELMRKLTALPAGLQAPVRQAVKIGVIKIHGDAVASVQRGVAGGRVYQKYNPRRSHIASLPGNPPATDTGTLVALTGWRFTEDGLSGEIFSQAAYGRHLEFGTTNMKARPWMFPAYEKNRKSIVASIGKAIKKVLGKLPKSFGILAGLR